MQHEDDRGRARTDDGRANGSPLIGLLVLGIMFASETGLPPNLSAQLAQVDPGRPKPPPNQSVPPEERDRAAAAKPPAAPAPAPPGAAPAARVIMPVDVAWLHLYVRDRRQALGLETALELTGRGKFTEALPQWQFLFDQPRDSWFIQPTGELSSIRGTARRRFEEQAPELAQAYLQYIGPEAKLELARAQDAQDPAAWLNLIRRFQGTPESFTAAEWLVKRWLDDGEWRLAVGLARRMLQSPGAAQHATPRLLKMASVAAELAGDAEFAAAVRDRLAAPAIAPREHQRLPDVSAGDPHRPAAGSPPVLDPEWRGPLEAAGTYPQLDRVLAEWGATQREQDAPAAVGWTPLVVGPNVHFRDLDTIRAVDVATGRTVWRYRSRSGLGELLSPSNEDPLQRRFRAAMLDTAAANSLVSGLSTDGRRLYAIDESEAMSVAGVYGLESMQSPNFSRKDAARNRLIALDLAATTEAMRLAWSSELSPDATMLQGHAFLGPPLATGSVVYAVSEHDRELCLTAFDAATGRVLWQQPIADAERSLIEDRGRGSRACTPVAIGDLIVCPTHIGLVVAVDAVTGELRWAHNSLEAPPDTFGQRFRNVSSLTQRRHGAFPGSPMAGPGVVLILPSQSDHLYCLDAETGMARWLVRNIDAQYLATTMQDRVLTIGVSSARAYDLTTGELIWHAPLPGNITGYGVPIPGGYLVPLDSGQVVNLDGLTGRARGFRFDPTPQPLGHLVATSDRILSLGALGLVSYRQAQPVLNELLARGAGEPSAETALRIAEVRLAEGNLLEGVEALEGGLTRAADDPLKSRIRRLLWESYFQLVREEPERADHWLARLQRLSEKSTPVEQARWLVAATARAADLGQSARVEEQFLQLAGLARERNLFECPDDRDLEVHGTIWLRMLQDRLEEPSRERLSETLRNLATADPLGPLGDAAEWLLPEAPLQALRMTRAAGAAAAAHHERAALLLSRSHPGETPAEQAMRETALARLLSAAEFPIAGAQALERATSRLATKEREALIAGFAQTPDEATTIEAWRRRQPIDWPVRRVSITSRSREWRQVGDPSTVKRAQPIGPYEDYQRSLAVVAPDSPLEWLMRNTERGTEVAVFDKLSSRKFLEQVLPFGASPPGSLSSLALGTLIPFTLPGEIRAISPLQGTTDHIAWSLALPEWTHRSGQALGGPATARRAFFQWKNVLFAVDPTDGHILWRRNDLEPTSGIYADPRIGLLADDDLVFVLGSDKAGYRLLDAATGRVTRTGILQQDSRFTRHDLGRNILHIGQTNEQQLIRLWDPAENGLILENPLKSRQLMARLSQDAVAWLTPDGRLRVFSLAKRAIVVDVPLDRDDIDGAASLRGFVQQGWYFISLGRNQSTASSHHYHMPIQDKLIPDVNIRDDVVAIGPGESVIRWRKTIPQRSFLELGNAPAPFVVAGALVRDKRDPNRRWLRFEAIDPATGFVLGVGDELPNDRLLHADYDGVNGVLRLIGRETEIEFRFDRAEQRLGVEPETL